MQNDIGDKIESNIIQKVFLMLKEKSGIESAELDKIIEGEIIRAKYLKESWQLHYAKERIKKAVKDLIENDKPKKSAPQYRRYGWFTLIALMLSKASFIFLYPTLYFLVMWMTTMIYKKTEVRREFMQTKKTIDFIFVSFFTVVVLIGLIFFLIKRI
jgi:hypothetical protein